MYQDKITFTVMTIWNNGQIKINEDITGTRHITVYFNLSGYLRWWFSIVKKYAWILITQMRD